MGLALVASLSAVSAQETVEQDATVEAVETVETVEQDKDRQYVTDQLRLSLYAQANSASQVIKLLQSGDILEIEQVQGPYALVNTPNGTRGWVKRGFLVTKPTSNLLLAEERQKNQSLVAELEKLNNSKVVIDQYEKDMDRLVEQVGALEMEKQKANDEIAELKLEIEAKQIEIDRKDETSAPAILVLWDTVRNHWPIVSPLLLVVILLTYLVSKQIVEARIRSKFHGIKIW